MRDLTMPRAQYTVTRKSGDAIAGKIDRYWHEVFAWGPARSIFYFICLPTMPEITRRIRLAWAWRNRFKRELYDIYGGCPVLTIKVRMLKVEVIETLLYGCVTWTLDHRRTSPLSSERHATNSSHGSSASSADNALATSCRTPMPSKRHALRERQDDHPQTTPPLFGGRTAEDQ